ncbi:TetR/AcrR family transcriptional regulator [Azospirillum sp. RWY-5-1]|uniref:TetR/AcrR family transcriptional regulator n=1 Tax=Azospirillum oleiclasticum TaxID=2735135 RepID=A0ABX2TEA5_9PROT|nr:TetR/AcrR family transcriptional regulator [Azospirillum oleiclasticum]NYZ15850.1 TetR/AcrR family transcriptional regulator [Azospirillum oleiclasticum]NYZ22120.1 TetR/AcrR family transcriptional regulator [Azospirillum oleiclasticum]
MPREKRQKKLNRAEKADENRKALFKAAAHVVGNYGYAKASIGRITQEANLAQGTFYLYFESRQDLFDQLLPAITDEMMEHIKSRLHGAADFFELEERGATAFFEFMTQDKCFFRILYETDLVSPKAAHYHYSLAAQKYSEVLRRARAEKQLRPLEDYEEEVLTYMMIAARAYLYQHIIAANQTDGDVVKRVVKAYINILRNGVGPRVDAGEPGKRINAGQGAS